MASSPYDHSYWAGIFNPPKRFYIDTRFYLFRYITSDKEYQFIKSNKIVFSKNEEGTYWTTLYTNDPKVAKCLLSLDRDPIYRVGGIPIYVIEANRSFIKRHGKVKPNNHETIEECKRLGIRVGGAPEYLITVPIFLVDIVRLPEPNP